MVHGAGPDRWRRIASFGRTLEQAIRARYSATVRALTRILDQRVDTAIHRGESPCQQRLPGELISGPVDLIVNRGMRPFAGTDAERIVG